MVFEGLFETYQSADEYMKTLAGLLQITVRLELKKIIAEANDAAVFFELETKAPAEATVLVAEWHQVKTAGYFMPNPLSTAALVRHCFRAPRQVQRTRTIHYVIDDGKNRQVLEVAFRDPDARTDALVHGAEPPGHNRRC
jgi:hypothetical protein